MSYDINLYEHDFLMRARTQGLGDWTGAPELPQSVREEITSASVEAGFRSAPQDPRFVAFAAAQGHIVADEYVLDTKDSLATLMVFRNSVAFSIPASSRSIHSIEQCLQLARGFASAHHLGFFDPQSGEVSS